MTGMDISIIIVNWNVADLLRAALASISEATQYLSVETIVVDNASRDSSVEMVLTEFPEVIVIANSDNKGFAAANNQGMRIARGKYFFILNPDTELKKDTLTSMYEYMEHNTEVAMIGPRLLNTDGSLQPSCRRFPGLMYQLSSKLFLDMLFPRTICNGYMMGDFKYDTIQEVAQPMGAAMFVRKSIVAEVGLMDEHNFVWFDEVDWCYQIKKAHGKILFYPHAELTHHQGKSFQLWRNPFSGLVWMKSRHYFISKNYGRAYAAMMLLVDGFFWIFYAAVIASLLWYVFR